MLMFTTSPLNHKVLRYIKKQLPRLPSKENIFLLLCLVLYLFPFNDCISKNHFTKRRLAARVNPGLRANIALYVKRLFFLQKLCWPFRAASSRRKTVTDSERGNTGFNLQDKIQIMWFSCVGRSFSNDRYFITLWKY